MYLVKRINLLKGILTPILLMGGVTVLGTLGYILIEGFNFLEALYMTIITIASVGFSEVRPLSEAGRIFTIFLILFLFLF